MIDHVWLTSAIVGVIDMIDAFSLSTAHLFGDALASQARLRYRVFVARRSLDHLHYRGLEYDEFDTPSAVYLVWRDDEQVVRGLARLLPTTRPYMVQQYWPFLFASGRPPVSSRIWEVTRVCVDKGWGGRKRLQIFPELMCGVQEFFRMHGIKAMIGATRPHLLTTFFENIEWLGEPAEIEGEFERAFYIATDDIRPRAHCERFGIDSSVLSPMSVASERLVA